ncbi:MAG: hypothetical protein KC940_09445, partial [Candidatus Omnitrophica bacterium]|nr:hypothetical protein [Candidatus Omnitrophota bacterium]
NGYSKPYLDWLSIGTATIGAGFAIFGHFLLRLRFDHQISKRAIIGTLLATPGAFYCFRDMGFPHAASMASIACFLWVWLRDPDRIDWKQIFLLSVPLSISALVRWQNSLFALAPVVYWLSLFPHGADPLRGLSQKITRILGLGALCFVFCLPQLLIFRLRGPSWLSLQHGGPEEFSWSTPKFFSLAFDDRYGLLFWHPFYFLCGLGGVLYLSRGVNWRTLLWIGGFAVWCWTAFLTQHHAWALPIILGLTFLPMFFVWMVQPGKWLPRPLALVFLVAAVEVYINASYILYHGGGDYGNRLVCDLVIFAAFGFAYLLEWLRKKNLIWLGAVGFVLCFGWSLALFWREVPKITRSPRNLTELLSHSTPFATLVQGLGHLDVPLFLSGVWRIFALSVCCFALLAAVLILSGIWRREAKGPSGIAAGLLALPVLVSLWLAVDFRRVDANLYLDNRESGSFTHLAGAEVWRQTMNTELSPFIPPGEDAALDHGRVRFHQILTPATPTQSWFLPKKWPGGKPTPYIFERLALLTRVWTERDLTPGEPIAEVSVSTFVPPATQSWILRAGEGTDRPTSLSLPPSSPDWFHSGLGAIPRYFTSQFVMSPTSELDVLAISLIPRDATLDIGAVWFSKSPKDRPLPWVENPQKRSIPRFDQMTFGQDEFQVLSLPARFHPTVSDPDRYFSPSDSDEDRPDPEFFFFEDPWRMLGGVPFEFQIGNWGGNKRTAWHVLDNSEPQMELSLPDEVVREVHVGIALGPTPEDWPGGPVAELKIKDSEGVAGQRRLFPGKDLNFWGEPYLPGGNLVWKESRGYFPPVGVAAISVIPEREIRGSATFSVELSNEAKKFGADLVIIAATARIEAENP